MSDLTIHKSIEVAAPRDRAWEVFTERIASWWPMATHSTHEERVKDVVIEPREGGVMYEVCDDGETAEWADVLVWEPPARLVLTWRVSGAEPTRLELVFSEIDGGTRLDLTHSGWEAREDPAGIAARYDSGWDYVLALFVPAAGGRVGARA